MSSSSVACLPSGRSFILQATLPAILLLLLASLASAQQTPVPARITQAIDPANLIVLKGNVHPLAQAQFDRGPAPSSLALNRMLLVLKRSPDQEAALESLLDQQQDKSSPNYHNWLTPQQFGQQFGPADQDVQTIVSWLESQGFRVDRVANGRGIIEFSGTAGQLQNAFHTEIHNYSINGKNYVANSTDPQIPAALAPVIAGVASLNSIRRKPMYRIAGVFSKSKETGRVTPIAAPSAGNGAPNYTYTCGFNYNTNQPIECYGVSPYDFATIYNVLPLWTASTPINGAGETIALVARTNVNPQDMTDFQTLFGLPSNPVNVVLNGPDPGINQSDETESDLDMEWADAVAPGAKIDLVASESTETSDGVDLSALYIVDNDLAPVMSESYGQCELGLGTTGNQFENNLWQQAAAEGITVFVSSGDNGSAGCDFFNGVNYPEPAQYGLQVNGIASTPYNVAVGGTDFNDFSNATVYWNSTNSSTTLASAKGYIPETTWNDTCTNGVLAQVGITGTAEANCNNPTVINNFGLLWTVGGGGGKSACTTASGNLPSNCSGGYAKPAWQSGTGVPADNKRDIPDVSLFASNGFVGNFYMICERDFPGVGGQPCSTNAFIGIGGTSASSPAFAGVMALVDQKTASSHGNANYVLYKLAAKSGNTCSSAANPATTCVFYDTPSGSTIAMPCARGTTNCNTSNGSDTYGVLSGYATGSGYDQATGLGSVNVANLVNDWNTVSNVGSTTTLQVNNGTAVNITHGSPVPVSVTVTPTSPIPTGSVSLLAKQTGSTTDFGTLTLNASGTASGTFSTLPGGTAYTVQAHFPGDANYQASDSNTVTVTVAPEASKTTLGIITFSPTTGQITNTNATNFPYGSPYILRSDVTNSSGTLCFNTTTKTSAYPCPTGTVTMTDNGTALDAGTFPLNSEGNAEDQPIQLTGGTHNLVANYGGDNSYLASSTTDALTVTPAATSTTASFNPPLQTVTIGAQFGINGMTTTQSNGAGPTGGYTVFDGTTQLSGSGSFFTFPASASFNGFAECQESIVVSVSAPSGPHTLTVKYNGDTNYASSTSAAVTVNAVYPDSTTVSANPTNVIYGQSTTITATIHTTNPQSNAALKPGGTISFSGISGTPTITTGPDANGNWMMTATLTASPQQSTFVTANYSGDSNYATSSNSVFVTVTIPDFTVASSSGALTITAGQTGTATITVTPTTSYASTVSLSCNAPFPGATCSFSPSSVSLSNSTAATSTLSVMTTAPSSTSSAFVLPTGVKPAPPVYPVGWWSLAAFLISAALAMLLLPDRRRLLRLSFGLAVLGLLSFAAGCGGGGSGGGGNPTPTTTSISTTSTKLPQNNQVTLTGNVTGSGSATPTGSVAFLSSNCQAGGTIALVSGAAQFQFLSPNIGTCGYSAQYSGDSKNLSSKSGTLNITFTGTIPVSVTGQTSTDTHITQVSVTLQ